MNFTSTIFYLFFPLVLAAYYLMGVEKRLQNGILLIASAVFYCWFDWRIYGLLIVSATLDFLIARMISIQSSQTQKRGWFIVSILVNLLPLIFLKYATLLLGSLTSVAVAIGFKDGYRLAPLMIPLGISYFTFVKISYMSDIYRGNRSPERNYLDFIAFITFFPTIIAGPIERSKTLLDQLKVKRLFDDQRMRTGLRMILCGFFKKLVIADNLEPVISRVFANPEASSGIELAMVLFLYSIQIYADFSGYSDIAIGIGRLLGFQLTRNFAFPYFSRNIGEFWRRWHISLSGWFRDYIFFPLGAGYKGKTRWIINTLITFTLCGLWHGANWTFAAWGALMGLYFIPLIIKGEPEKQSRVVANGRIFPSIKESLQMGGTFLLVTLAWVFFRADSLPKALQYLGMMVTRTWSVLPNDAGLIWLAGGLILLEWLQRAREYPLDIRFLPVFARWGIYVVLLAIIMIFGNLVQSRFVYAQF